jgi:NAD(P)-dependent dehydrogenase (short-subunit alcohol dehydrogenase family)
MARRKSDLERVADRARELGALSVVVIDGDAGTEEGCRSAVSRTLEAFGGELDILVLNHVVGFWGASGA